MITKKQRNEKIDKLFDENVDKVYDSKLFNDFISENRDKKKKVKCIDNQDDLYLLTIGKTYEVIDDNENGYWIERDDCVSQFVPGTYTWYHKKWFGISSEWRNEKIDKLLDENN